MQMPCVPAVWGMLLFEGASQPLAPFLRLTLPTRPSTPLTMTVTSRVLAAAKMLETVNDNSYILPKMHRSCRKLLARLREQRGYLSGNILRQCHVVQRRRNLAPRHPARPILAATATDGERAVVGTTVVIAPLVTDPLLDCNRMARGVDAVRMRRIW